MGRGSPLQRRRRRGRRRGSKRRVYFRGMAQPERDPAWRVVATPGRSDSGECRRTGCFRGPRQRQINYRNGGPVCLYAAMVLLLWRSRRQNRGCGDPKRQTGHFQLHATGTARRRGRDHTVEFAAVVTVIQARAGARRRQHDRDKAVRIHLDIDITLRRTRCRGRFPSRRR